MRKDHDVPMFWSVSVTSAATQVWCVDCVWPLVTSRPEPQCPVSRVTCDTVWRVTVTSHCVSQARVTRPQWRDDQVTYHWYSLTHHHPRASSRSSDAGRWMSGHGQMQTVQKWLKLHWLRIKFGMSFIIHIFLTIVFHCIKIIDSVICCKRIFYMLLDYGDYGTLLYLLIL